MSLLPDTINGKIEFVQSKIPAWQLSATQIGTTSAAVTALNTKLTTAQAKLAAAILARETAKTATVDLHLAMRDLVNATSDIVKAVRTRSFVDATVPAGTPSVTYQVVAVRSTAIGVAAQFTVNFGVGGGGEAVASVQTAPKLAA